MRKFRGSTPRLDKFDFLTDFFDGIFPKDTGEKQHSAIVPSGVSELVVKHENLLLRIRNVIVTHLIGKSYKLKKKKKHGSAKTPCD
jgi:hypothetical protein